MSKKKGFSILETMIPRVRLLPRARELACRLGWYLSSDAARITRARVVLFTMLKSFSARDTVAVDTPAFLATASRLAAISRDFLPRFDIIPSPQLSRIPASILSATSDQRAFVLWSSVRV